MKNFTLLSKFYLALTFTLCFALFSQAQVQVTGAVSGNGSYTTLRNAFTAINAAAQTGAIIQISLTGDTNEGVNSAVLNAGTWTTLFIQPSGSRIITGATTAGNPLINLNGADNVQINGLNVSGNSLTISNTTASGTANTSTIRFIGDASQNTITNCTIVGSETSSSSGTIYFSTGTTTGNDANTISNCTISAAGTNLPVNAIYSAGTSVAIDNSNNSINSNNIQDFFNPSISSGGVNLASNSASWTIYNNHFFQTATRTTTANTIYIRPIIINTASAGGYTITNNIIGFSNASGTGVSTYNGTANVAFRGIELTSNTTVSSIQGNTIAGIDFTTALGTGASPGLFCGIYVASGAVNVGTSTGNNIGSTTSNSSIVVTTTSATVSRFQGIYINTSSSSSSIQNNTIAGISTGGTATTGYSFMGIYTNGTSGNFTINNNIIGSSSVSNSNSIGISGTTTTGVCSFYGIYNTSTGTPTITNNQVNNASIYGTGASLIFGIYNNGGIGFPVVITSNTINGLKLTGTGNFRAIYNGIAASSVSISQNTVKNQVEASGTSSFIAIANGGAVTGAIVLDSNKLGDTTGGLITYTVASSGGLLGLTNTNGTSTATLSMQNNDIRGVVHNVTASNSQTYYQNSSATLSQNISNNTLTNLAVATSGNINLISNNVALAASGSQTVSNNSIVGSFSKSVAGGTLTIFSTVAASATGATIINNTNNFSNITITGATTLNGWINRDTGLTNKTISNNVFNNWAGGTSTIVVMDLDGFSTGSSIFSNTISGISDQGTITGINIRTNGNASALNVYSNSITSLSSTGTGNTVTGINNSNNSTAINIYSNTINTLTSSGLSSTVSGISTSGSTGTTNIYSNTINGISESGTTSPKAYGIQVSGGNSIKVYKNTIYDISTTGINTTGNATGILLSGGTSVTLNNNKIADIKAPLSNNPNAASSGVYISSTSASSTYELYYNSVYLNATSTGTNFGTAGIYAVTNTIATTGKLLLKNNVIVNISTANGTGKTVANMRSTTTVTNFDSTSDYNLYYAGTPSTTNLIYYDFTNSDQALATYQNRVTPREANSVTENVSFLSTSGSNSNFLKPNPAIVTNIESNGITVSGITDDFYGTIRQGNTGYSGTGTSPDMGAVEFEGTAPIYAVVVSGALSGNGGYNTLGSAFAAINAGSQTATDIIVSIKTDTSEGTAAATLNAGVWNTLSIRPFSGNRIISGATTAGNALINLNGADNVTIDGLNTGGKSLTIENTTVSGTTGTAAIKFINDATNNTITNCTLKGSETTTTSGVVFYSSGTTTGNDGNTISNCTITASGTNLPTNGIYSAGTSVAVDNSSNIITGNNIQDYFNTTLNSCGILLGSNSAAWTITSNKFFQSATRSTVSGTIYIRPIAVNTASAGGYTISNNIIGFANGSGTGTTIYDGPATTYFRGIEALVNTTTSSIQGNQISGINFSTANGTTGSPGIFTGINLSGAFNVGTITGNTIGSSSTNNSIVVTSSSTNSSRMEGIYINSTTTSTIQNNIVSGISTGGGATNGYFLIGINTNLSGSFIVDSNTIGSLSQTNSISSGTNGTTTTGVCSFYGIYGGATGSPQTITNNNIFNVSVYGSGATSEVGILNIGGTGSTISISNNTINGILASGTGTIKGISNNAAANSITISNNLLKNFTINSTTAGFSPVDNVGVVTNTIALENNQLGDATNNLVTYSVANSATFYGVSNGNGSSTATLTIKGNSITGINHTITGSSAHRYFYNNIATLSQDISNNTLNNLSVNTTGSITFISDSVALTSTGFQTITNNSIVGNYAITASGGSLTVFTSSAVSAVGATFNNSNNNFSNITVSGSTSLIGWAQKDTGLNTKTINNNTFSNWTAGTVVIIPMDLNGFSTGSTVTGNTISTINGQSTITGINIGANGNATNLAIASNSVTGLTSSGASSTVTGLNLNIGSYTTNVYSNTISGLIESGTTTPVINGIQVTSGTSVKIYKNKLYDFTLSGANSTGVLYGLSCTGGTSVIAYNNIIGDLKSPISSNPTAAIRGISVTSSTASTSFELYNNTVYLNATSSGTNFGTAGLYHTVSGTSTTANLLLKNNLIINNSTQIGTGLTVAYFRSANNLNNYNTASNNNLFYGGTPSTSNLIFYDFTNKDQTITTFIARVTPRETLSQTENTGTLFQSTIGSNSNYLRLPNGITSYAESGAVLISTPDVTKDFWDVSRPYTSPANYGTASDIGASEFDGFINCATPTTQATSFVAGSVTDTTAAGSFTAATGSPTGYLVVRSIGSLTVNPTDGTTYATNATFGNGTVVQSGSTLSFTASALSPNTAYTFTIYTYYTNFNCGNGPKYNKTTPLIATNTTCSAAPTGATTQLFCISATVANLTATGTAIKWYNVSTGGTALTSTTALVDGTTYYATQTVSGCESKTRFAVYVVIGTTSVGGSVASNQTICSGTQPTNLTVSGNNGSILKWQRATNTAFTSATDITSTSSTLTGATIGNLTVTTYFRAVSQSGSCTAANSNYATVTIDAVPVGGTVSSDQTICTGTQPSGLSVSGFIGTVVKWQKATDVSFTTPTDIASTSTSLTGATIGNLSTTTYFRAVIQNGVCSTVNSSYATITVNQISNGGTLVSDQTICTNTQPADLSLSSAIGTVVKWQQATSSTFVGASDINVTSNVLNGATIGNISQVTYFRAIVQNGACASANSNYVTISVTSPPTAGSVSSNQTICAGSSPASLTLSGNTGSIVKWQSSSSSSFSTSADIASTASTLTSLLIGNLSQTTYFRAVVQSGSCPSVYSAYATITVNPGSVGGSINSNQSICTGSQPTNLSLTGYSGTILKWQSATDVNFTTVTDIASTSATLLGFTIGNLTVTTYFRAIVQYNSCPSATSNYAVVTVNAQSVGGSVTPDQAICTGTAPADISLSGNTGNVVIWQKATDIDFTTPIDISVSTNTLQGSTIGNLTATTYFRAIVQNGNCSAVASSYNTVVVNSVSIGGFVTSSQTIGYGTQPSDLTLNENSGSILRWEKASDINFTVPTSITSTLNILSGSTVGNLTDTVYIRAIVQNGSCSSTSSDSVLITVAPPSVGGQVTSNQSLCYNTQPNDLTLADYLGDIVKWQKSSTSDFSSPVDIATTSTVLSGSSIGNLTATTYFRVAVQNGISPVDYSSYTTITVNPITVGGTTTPNQNICTGSQPADISLTSNVGSVLKWQKASDSSFTSPIDIFLSTSGTLTSENIGALTATTYFRAIVQSGNCAIENSNYVTITVSTTSVGGTVASDQTICAGLAPNSLTVTGINGNVIKWQKANENTFTYPVDVTSSSTTITSGEIGVLSDTTYFRAVVQNGGCSSVPSTNYATITVNPASIGGAVSSSQAICTGTSPADLTLSGYSGTIVKWQKSSSAVFSSPIDIASSAATLSGTTIGNLTTTTYFRAVVQNGSCAVAYSSLATITINATSIGGSVASSQTICSGSQPNSITLTGQTGGVANWQSATDPSFSTYTTIAGTSTTLTGIVMGALTTSTYFRAIVQNGSCSTVPSAAVLITVSNPPSAGTVASNQSICSGTASSDLNLTGNTASILKWQKDTNSLFSTAVDISNTSATLSSSTVGSLTATTYFRAVINGGYCANQNSSFAVITIIPNSNGGVLSSDQVICSGSQASSLTLASTVGTVVKWQKATTVNFASAIDISNTSTTLTGAEIGTVTQTTYIRAVVQSGSCTEAYSNYITLSVNATVPGSVSSNQTVCVGNNVADLTLSGEMGTILKWQKATDSSFSSPIDIASTSNTLSGTSVGAITSTTYVRAVVQNGTCAVANSDYVTISLESTTWDGTSWSNGEPSNSVITKSVLFTGNYSGAINLYGCSVLVSNNAVVNFTSGYNLYVNGAITVETGSSLTMNNDSNIIQYSNATNSGNVTINRNSSPLFRLDYTLWSSPVLGSQTLEQFSPLTTSNRFYTYNTLTNVYNSVNPTTSTFDTGKGYLIRMPNNWVPYNATTPTTPLPYQASFVGTPNNGSITATNLVDGGVNYRYNAVGNPYPSTLKIVDFINGNSNAIEGTIWLWRKTNDANNSTSYSTCTIAGCTRNNGHTFYFNDNLISIGQGFLVNMKANQTSLSFTNSMRTDNNVDQFFRTTQKDRFWLDLTNSTTTAKFGQLLLVYLPGASTGYDSGLDGIYINDCPTAISGLAGNEELTINARPIFNAQDIAPVQFKTDNAGTYTISINRTEGVFNGSQEIFIRDNQLGIVQSLTNGGYTFASAAGTFPNRFDILYQNTALSTNTAVFNENTVVVYKNQGQVHINAGTNTIATVKIFDIRGRLLLEKNKINASQTALDTSTIGNQVLIVQVTNDSQEQISKKVIN